MAKPTKYRPEMCAQATKLCRLGLTDEELAKFFEVSRITIMTWKTRHPDFAEALMAGKVVADAEVAESLYRRALGYSHEAVKIFVHNGEPVIVPYTEHYPPDTTAALAWLNNRRRTDWKRSPDPYGGEDDLPPTKVIFEVRDARRPERQRDSSRGAEQAAG